MKGRNEALALLAAALFTHAAPTQGDVASPMFTERAERRAKCRAKPRDAIDAGVRWLLAHQEADGHWSAHAFMEHDPAGDRCDGPGTETNAHGVTALALLAVLAQADDEYEQAAKRAADWLAGQIDPQTGRQTNDAHDFIYGHAMATAALAEAAALHGEARHRDAAARMLAYLESHRTPGAGFGYQPDAPQSDSSILSWCAMAYATCLHAGIETPAQGLAEALAWLETVTGTDGHVGYRERGEGSARMPGDHGKRFPIELVETLTAAGLHARMATGLPADDPIAIGAAERLLARPPSWSLSSRDLYYWMHGSTAMSQFDGDSRQRTWRDHVEDALLPNQRSDGSAAGSWDATGVWGKPGGRVYATAAAVLSLSADHRAGSFSPAAELAGSKKLRRLARHVTKGELGKVQGLIENMTGDGEEDAAALRRLRWHLVFAEQRDQRAIRAVLADRDGDLRDRLERLEAMAKRWKGQPMGDDTARELASLRADPTVQGELAGLAALDKIMPKYTKARRGNQSKRRKMHNELVRLAEKHKGTKAGARMLELARTLH